MLRNKQYEDHEELFQIITLFSPVGVTFSYYDRARASNTHQSARNPKEATVEVHNWISRHKLSEVSCTTASTTES